MITVSSFVLLLVRLVVAVAFSVASLHTLRDVKKAAKRNETPVPIMACIGLAEGAGALGVASGVLGQWAAIGLMLIMLATISIHVFKWKSPYWAEKGGWEYDLMLFTFCSVIAVFGVGAIAL